MARLVSKHQAAIHEAESMIALQIGVDGSRVDSLELAKVIVRNLLVYGWRTGFESDNE